LKQRVAVITGAAGGIGASTVGLFRGDGWYVVGIDQVGSQTPAADRVLLVDVADEQAIEGMIESLQDLGRIDALVNNAAISLRGPLIETTAVAWDQLMAVNLRAAFLTTRAAVPLMRDYGGAIVNVSSVHAVATTDDVAAYAAAKAGLIGLTRATALELALHKIRVNAVLPGAVDTPMLRGGADPTDVVQRIAHHTPLGRVAEPNEIAEAILFLADGRRSSFITGQTLVVDGGALAKLSTE
jgi:glucose 1-dehydrogenase